MASYIAFMEVDISKSLAVEFAYVYRIKALARNEGFRYTSKRRLDVEGIWRVRDNMGNYKDIYFFYPSDHPRELWVASK